MTTVLERAMPFDGQTIYPADWRAMMDAELLDGPLRSVLNQLVVTAPAVGLSVDVDTGHAYIGGVHVENTASKRLVCDPAASDFGRKDLVVAGIEYATKTAYLDIITGLASAGPVAPEPTVDRDRREIPLAEVTVAANDAVLAAGDVRDVRRMAVPTQGAGGLIGRLSVDADAVTATTADDEQLFPGWSLDVVLQLGRVYRISFDGVVSGSSTSDYDTRVRDGGLTGTLLLGAGYQDRGGLDIGQIVRRTGLFEALDGGVHTLVVTNRANGTDAVRTLFGATGAAAANGYLRPWLLVRDAGPVHT